MRTYQEAVDAIKEALGLESRRAVAMLLHTDPAVMNRRLNGKHETRPETLLFINLVADVCEARTEDLGHYAHVLRYDLFGAVMAEVAEAHGLVDFDKASKVGKLRAAARARRERRAAARARRKAKEDP